MLTKEAITAHIWNGFEAISNPEYRVELRVLPWFTMGQLSLSKCSSILSVGAANHTICAKTWSFITYCVHAIIETGCGVNNKSAYCPANAEKRPIFNALPLCDYSGTLYLWTRWCSRSNKIFLSSDIMAMKCNCLLFAKIECVPMSVKHPSHFQYCSIHINILNAFSFWSVQNRRLINLSAL